MNFITNKKQQRDSSIEFGCKHPHRRRSFFDRPDLSRRAFFQLAGAGLTGSYLLPRTPQRRRLARSSIPGSRRRNSAKSVIFIHLTGAMSHVDTFDLKVTNGVTPDDVQPDDVRQRELADGRCCRSWERT